MPKQDTEAPTEAQPMLSTELFDKMAHAIGHRLATGCSISGGRNYYAGAPDDEDWADAVTRGLATSRESPLMRRSVYYHVTPAGRAAIEHDAALRGGQQ